MKHGIPNERQRERGLFCFTSTATSINFHNKKGFAFFTLLSLSSSVCHWASLSYSAFSSLEYTWRRRWKRNSNNNRRFHPCSANIHTRRCVIRTREDDMSENKKRKQFFPCVFLPIFSRSFASLSLFLFREETSLLACVFFGQIDSKLKHICFTRFFVSSQIHAINKIVCMRHFRLKPPFSIMHITFIVAVFAQSTIKIHHQFSHNNNCNEIPLRSSTVRCSIHHEIFAQIKILQKANEGLFFAGEREGSFP